MLLVLIVLLIVVILPPLVLLFLWLLLPLLHDSTSLLTIFFFSDLDRGNSVVTTTNKLWKRVRERSLCKGNRHACPQFIAHSYTNMPLISFHNHLIGLIFVGPWELGSPGPTPTPTCFRKKEILYSLNMCFVYPVR
jgi:hypothetical protein